MTTLSRSLTLLLLSVSLAAQAEQISLPADKAIELKADYYQAAKDSNRAVLMLHQCNYNRTMYEDIGQQLAQRGIHALSLDFRGFGQSVNQEFDVNALDPLPDEEQRKIWQAMTSYWPADVQLAYNYLRSKITETGTVGVIGASCGGSQAITLAESSPIQVMAFFSSGQNDKNIARYKSSLADKAALIIASEEDTGTYSSAKKLFESAKNANSKFITYKGADHGYPLLDKDRNLSDTIVNWFDSQLTVQ